MSKAREWPLVLAIGDRLFYCFPFAGHDAHECFVHRLKDVSTGHVIEVTDLANLAAFGSGLASCTCRPQGPTSSCAHVRALQAVNLLNEPRRSDRATEG